MKPIRLLPLALAGILACAGSQAASAPPPRAFADINVVLLEVRIDQSVLTDAFSAYQVGGQTWLPLGELSRLLTIAIRTRPAEGVAQGFVVKESRLFSLNLASGTVTIGERVERFDPALVRVQEDDIYVEAGLLSQWLPLNFTLDLSSLALTVQAREPLPLQLRLARERKAGGAGASGPAGPLYPRLPSRYGVLGAPMIDQTFGVSATRTPQRRDQTLSSATFISGDLAGMQASVYLNGTTQGGDNSARLTLGRDDPDGGLLGPLRARSVAIGSVAVPGLSQVARSSSTGNGFAIGNLPFDRPSSFDRHTFQGDLPPGWDVELFFNEALIGFQQSRADGKYVFADRPLVIGKNEFRLVFHGPQGQVRIERQSFLLDNTLVVPGQFYYQAAAHRDQAGLARAIARAEWGVARNLSLNAALVHQERNDGSDTFRSLGALAYAGPVIGTVQMVHKQGGGRLLDLGIKTRLGNLLVSDNHTVLRDFSSDIFAASSDPVRSRNHLRIDGLLPGAALARMPITLELTRDRFASGQTSTLASALVVSYLRGLSVTNQLQYQALGSAHNTTGSLQVGGLVREIGLRGQLAYTVSPERKLAAVGVAADKTLDDGYRAGLDLLRTVDNPETRLTATLTKSVGQYGYALSLGRSSRGETSFGGQLFISLSREPRSSRWIMNAQPMANAGALSARVFVDRNMNGVMDAGELPVRAAGLNLNGMLMPVRTDANGIALLTPLMPNLHADVAVSIGTLEDPQLTPVPKGVGVVPRGGHVSMVDFPLVLTSEIDGTVTLHGRGKPRPVGDIEIELLDPNGVVAGTASTASDGFYIVPFVPPGTYTLRIAPAQLARLKLRANTSHNVVIGADGKFVNGRDFQLVDAAAPN